MTGNEITKISLRQFLEKVNDDIYEKLIGFDIVEYTFFFVEIIKDNEGKIILECKDIHDDTFFFDTDEFNVETRMRIIKQITRITSMISKENRINI